MFIALCGIIFFVYAKHKFNEEYILTDAQEVLVERGTGLNQLASILSKYQVIDNPYWFIFV